MFFERHIEIFSFNQFRISLLLNFFSRSKHAKTKSIACLKNSSKKVRMKKNLNF
jgi:hypothetical protein